MKNTFEFSSLSANTNSAFSFKSSEVIPRFEDDSMIRGLVMRALDGEIINLPGYQISMVGSHNKANTEFALKLFQNSMVAPKRGEIPNQAVLLSIFGTTTGGSLWPMVKAKNYMDTQFKFVGIPEKYESRLTIPNTPYAVDTVNYYACLVGDSSFFLSGMSGRYSVVLSCLAIDILLSAGASGKDAGQRDAREVVKTPQSAGSASDRIGADVPEEYYRWF